MPARRPSSELQDPRQSGLFSFVQAPPVLPPGMAYQPGFLSPGEERRWLAVLRELGGQGLPPDAPLPEVLEPLRHRVAGWLRISPDRLLQVLVREHRPGAPEAGGREQGDFEPGAEISLGSPAVLRLRSRPTAGSPGAPGRQDTLHLEIAPCSIYRISGEARRRWQCRVLPPLAPRWSVTFGAAAANAGAASPARE